MIRILLVDDHKIIRDGIKAMLDGNNEIDVVGECNDGALVADFLIQNQVDVILMDVSMPELNGIETTESILEKYPDAKIIALTMHNQESYITKMLKAGAVGYILKNTGCEELIKAITVVNMGQNYFSSDVSDIMMSKFMKKTTNTFVNSSMFSNEDLTVREREIIKLISKGLTNSAIGNTLFISSRTVDTHRRNLLQKLGVKNTAGLVRFAIENDLSY